MYPELDALREHGESGRGARPLIMSEYSHAMGNSNGSLADYWDVITSTPGLQGGFVWEWKDQALRQRLPSGRSRLAYGGQFGDVPNDGNFVADGLVSADLEPHPAMRELAWVHRPVTVVRARGGLVIENRQSFSDLSRLLARWELSVDGDVVRRGVLRVPRLEPGAKVTVALPCELPAGSSHLTVRWETKRASWFAPAGHLVAWDQVVLGRSRRSARSAVAGRPADDLVAPQLNLWRAATDNDGFKLMPDKPRRAPRVALREWLTLGLERADPDELVDHDVRVERDEYGTTYRHVVDVPLDDLPRVGVMFRLPTRFTRVRWYGRGPHENYPDRNRSAMLGVWEGEPDESPYLMPQEFGLRTDCHWFEFVDPGRDETVRIDVLRPSVLHVSATHHLPSDLYAAATAAELVRRAELVVCLDVAHRGLGTASCGPDVLPQYRLTPGRYEFAYRVSLR
jgi:beta-galactosidase